MATLNSTTLVTQQQDHDAQIARLKTIVRNAVIAGFRDAGSAALLYRARQQGRAMAAMVQEAVYIQKCPNPPERFAVFFAQRPGWEVVEVIQPEATATDEEVQS